MAKGLDALQGKPISTAFQVIGYPDGKQQFPGADIYIWSTSSMGGMMLPQTATTVVQPYGGAPVYGTTTYNQYVPMNASYQIKIMAEPHTDTIRSWEGYGNEAGAVRYASPLYKYYLSTLPKKH